MKKLMTPILCALILVGLATNPVRADMAPPYYPPGSNVAPGGEITQVRMMAEIIELTISASDASRIKVTFTMRNLGSEEEKMEARFPLRSDNSICFEDFCPEIEDLIVVVGGNIVRTERQLLPYTYNNNDGSDTPWAVFSVAFPPQKDVIVEVSYSAVSHGEYPYEVIDYILETGAGWKDSIGSVDIVVQLPYEVNSKNLIDNIDNIGFGETTAGGVVDDTEIRWHYENLEPTRRDNFSVAFIAPSLWGTILRESATVSNNPNDGEAWGRLGKAYKEIARIRGYVRGGKVGEEMFDLSRDAYEKCLALLPNDSLWHFGYADLLWAKYLSNRVRNLPDSDGILPIVLSHLQTALEIDPTNEKVRELLTRIDYFVPGAVQLDGENIIFIGLTATPLPPTSWARPSKTLSPTLTVIASPRASVTPFVIAESLQNEEIPTPIESPTATNPMCGSTALILPALAGAIWVARRKR